MLKQPKTMELMKGRKKHKNDVLFGRNLTVKHLDIIPQAERIAQLLAM